MPVCFATTADAPRIPSHAFLMAAHLQTCSVHAHASALLSCADRLQWLLCAGYTRIPVYEKDPQDIIGILYTKDLILVDPGDAFECPVPCADCHECSIAPPKIAVPMPAAMRFCLIA